MSPIRWAAFSPPETRHRVEVRRDDAVNNEGPDRRGLAGKR